MTPDARDLQAARASAGGHDPAAARDAFARLYDRHAPVVRALCRRHTATEAECDDALQETFIRAFRMLDKVDSPRGLRTWLYAISRRVCAERRRAAGRRARHERTFSRRQGISMNGPGAPTAPPLQGAGPDDAAERTEQLELLGKALDELPDQERLAIHLYYLDPDPVAAAGESLGLSRSAFYKLLARAREHLAAHLTKVHA